MGVGRPGERSAYVAEQLALEQRFRDRGAIDDDEWFSRAHAPGVNRARREFLPCAVFSEEQDGGLGGRHPRERLPEGSCRFGVSQDLVRPSGLLDEPPVLPDETIPIERISRGEEDPLDRRGLLDEIVRSELHGLDGPFDRAVSGQHDRGHGEPALPHRGEQREAVHLGHLHVQKDEIDPSLIEETGGADEILGNAEATRALRQTLARVAASEAPALLLGENGTGKELAARAIHAGSARARKPLVIVNCAAIPESLFESELFGHVRGAFTGATDAHRGKFQQADGGTLFLDEIGETPARLQPKLLRALELGDVETIGGRGPERVDVRLIAATNRDLQAEIAAGRFRPDLYYRIAVVPVQLPPLRERADDVPMLAKHFLDAACRKNRAKPKQLDPRAIADLTQHRWPGNVRELRNAMERVAILVASDVVDASHLAFLDPVPSDVVPIEDSGTRDLASMMERHERALVLAALLRNRWKMTRTADELGLERSHLYKKLKALGIDRPVED